MFEMDTIETSLDTNRSKMERDSSCGLFKWRPISLQKFVTYKYYVLVYVFISIAQSMVFSYLTVVLSTIEKQFGLKVCFFKKKILVVLFVLLCPDLINQKFVYISFQVKGSGLGIFWK